MHGHPVILFDGICNFCNNSVNFVIRRDKKRLFRYAPLQSDTGKQLQQQFGFDPADLRSFLLVYHGQVYSKTTAAIKVMQLLGGGWQVLGVLLVFPKFLRDPVYDFIAANRYRWFGKKEACMIPSPEVRSLFLS